MSPANAWQAALERNMLQRPSLIVHGNIRDRYVDGPVSYPGLRALLGSYAGRLAGQAGLTSSVRVYDWVRGHRIIADDTPHPTPPPSAATQDADAVARDLEAIGSWLAGEEGGGGAHTTIIEYADLLVPFQQAYGEADRRLLIRLEKLLGNVTAPHHLMLVALQDTWLPPHLYTEAPRVATIRIPMPDEKERAALLDQVLHGALSTWKPDEDVREAVVRMTAGLYLVDFANVLSTMAAERVEGEQQAREVLTEWRTGRRVSPWSNLSIRRVFSAKRVLSGEGGVVGQPEAVERVGRGLIMARAGLTGLAGSHGQKPKMAFVFAGPTGVGKTELAKQLAKFVFGDAEALIRFDMSEYKGEFTISRLLGAPPGYVGHEQGGQLTSQVRERPFSVLLFDEIEKADPRILDVFLQILDDGRLTDSRGQTVFFGETAIIFTTNIGARSTHPEERPVLDQLLHEQGNDVETLKRLVRDHFMRSVEHYFSQEIGRPELLNRLRSGIVPFNPIVDDADRARIAEGALATVERQFAERYREHQIKLCVDRAIAPLFLGTWRTCANEECQHVVLIQPSGESSAEPSDERTCPMCGTEFPLDSVAMDGSAEALGFGGRGIVDDVEAVLSFDLAQSVLLLEERGGLRKGSFVVGAGKGGRGGTLVLDVSWRTADAG